MAIAIDTTRLRHARESAGMTRQDLARHASVDYTHLCRIEAGVVHPGPRALRRIADGLGLDPRSLALPLEAQPA